jgi:hypothetical protein
MQLSRVEKCGYLVVVVVVMTIVIFGWMLGKFSGGEPSNARIGLGSQIRIQQRLPEERNFIRYTTGSGRLTFPSAQGTAELCRRFRVSQNSLLNANGQRNSPMLQPDSAGQIRIPL